jgi:Tfp pilus assembly protein PilF
MVGVVRREVAPHLNRPDYTTYLEGLFAREKVTHLAVLRNWCEVVNVEALFQADPVPEILEVFPWIPGKTHMVPVDASLINRQAAQQLRDGNLEGAAAAASQSLAVDPLSSRTWLILGLSQEYSGKTAEAEASYAQALRLFPGFADATVRMANVLVKENRTEEARTLLRELLVRKPGFAGAVDLLKKLDRPSDATRQ